MRYYLFFVGLFLFYACTDELADLSKDPNHPGQVPPFSLLPGVQNDAFRMPMGDRGGIKSPLRFGI